MRIEKEKLIKILAKIFKKSKIYKMAYESLNRCALFLFKNNRGEKYLAKANALKCFLSSS
jgi:hypothetical protein